jgi:hypothetical protein
VGVDDCAENCAPTDIGAQLVSTLRLGFREG